MKKVLLAYVPVLHGGYWELFVRNDSVKTLYVFGPKLIAKFDPLRKDIRALPPYLIKDAIQGWRIFDEILIAEEYILKLLNRDRLGILMPEDDVCRQVAEEYLTDCKVELVPIFLRWDQTRILAQVEGPFDRVIEADEFVSSIFRLALKESRKSPDWWRQIGAVAVKDGEILLAAFNRHVPSANHVWTFGDPRSNFKKGIHFELSPALHAEAGIVAEAARREDLCLEDTDLYVTTFPCPPCAKLIAYSGIKRLFFLEGYSVYDGADVLRARGVEMIRVRM